MRGYHTGIALALALACAAAAHARPCGPAARIVIAAEHADHGVLVHAAHELNAYAARLFHRDWSLRQQAPDPDLIVLKSEQAADGVAALDETDGYELRPTRSGLTIVGRNDRSVLYGVYELIRSWGARFYLSGDVLPESASCTLPDTTITRTASLKMRGAHPYPDFLAGPSSWDLPQFEAYVGQLPKLGLNFFGIHQYTYEPYVDYEVDGLHPRSGHLETSATREWGFGNIPPCRFEVGRKLFGSCEWGSATALEPRTPAERYARAQALLARALGLAHELGLVTAFGFEPMSNDPELAAAASTPAGARHVLEGRIDGVLSAFPTLDYLWLFADESHQADEARLKQTYGLISDGGRHLRAAHPRARLMIGGWNVERSLREYDVARDGVDYAADAVFTSYGNYDPWRTVTEGRPALFQGLAHAHAMAAWCEYDGRLLAGLQPNVTAYESLLPQLRDSGALGFFILHWNTRLCDSSFEYLSRQAWAAPGAPEAARDFYARSFRERFGVERGPVDALMLLEELNRGFAYAHQAFWLMADDWTPEGAWRRLAEAIEGLRAGHALTAEDAEYFRGQAAQARIYLPRLSALEGLDRPLAEFTRECRRDCAHARFLAARVRYFAAYFREYVKLSLGLEGVPEGRLAGLRRALDLTAWKRILASYARDVDDRGEKGLVVSLNQKTLAGLRRLERALGRAKNAR